MTRNSHILILVFLVAAGCEEPAPTPPPAPVPEKGSADQLKKEVSDVVDAALAFSQKAKNEFLEKMDKQLAELDVKIAELREKGKDLTDEAKTKWDEKIVLLESKRDALTAKLAEARESGETTWKELKSSAQSALDDVEQSLKETTDKP